MEFFFRDEDKKKSLAFARLFFKNYKLNYFYFPNLKDNPAEAIPVAKIKV